MSAIGDHRSKMFLLEILCVFLVSRISDAGQVCYSQERLNNYDVITRRINCSDPKANIVIHEYEEAFSFSEMLAHMEHLNSEAAPTEPGEVTNTPSVPGGATTGTTPVTCPRNMVPAGDNKTCDCQQTCADPSSCYDYCHLSAACICPLGFLMNASDHCIPVSECGCFMTHADGGNDTVVRDDGTYLVPERCGNSCFCTADQLTCVDACTPHGVCELNATGWHCSCEPGYGGDGRTCNATSSRDCHDIFDSGHGTDGVYYINPEGPLAPFPVNCKFAHGLGYTVIQRQDGSENFYRNWTDYKNGFGSPVGGMWLGNDKLYYLTNQKTYKLRFDVTDRTEIQLWTIYSDFRIGNESDKYRLVSTGSAGTGNIGRMDFQSHLQNQFSTYDQDNDGQAGDNCAEVHRGGWWYGKVKIRSDGSEECTSDSEDYCHYIPIEYGCIACAGMNLNGNQSLRDSGRSIYWRGSYGYDCGYQYSEMVLFYE